MRIHIHTQDTVCFDVAILQQQHSEHLSPSLSLSLYIYNVINVVKQEENSISGGMPEIFGILWKKKHFFFSSKFFLDLSKSQIKFTQLDLVVICASFV